MENRYLIYMQYSVWGAEGKTFCPWFLMPMQKFSRTEEEAKEQLKAFKESVKYIDAKSHVKRNYEIRVEDVSKWPPPKIHYSHKGRPKKEEVEEKKKIASVYWVNR